MVSPDLRDLLHAAAPDPEELDVGALRARVRTRARRRRVMQGAGLAVVLALAGGLTAVVLTDEPGEKQIDVVDVPTSEATTTTTTRAPATTLAPTTTILAPPPTTPVLTLPADFSGRAIAVTADTLWVAGEAAGSGWQVRQYAAANGDLLATIPLPGAVRAMVVAEQALWVWGGGDGAAAVGGVGLIDVHDAELLATFGWDDSVPDGERLSVRDLTVLGGEAWVSESTGERVFRLRPVDGALEATPVATNGPPEDIVSTDDGHIWVAETESGTIARIDPETMTVVERNGWDGARMAWDPATRTVWTGTAVQLEERMGFRTGDPLRTLDHTGLTDLQVHGLDLWVVEEGRVTHYRRSWPSLEVQQVATGGWLEQITGLAVDGDTGWVIVGDEIGRLSSEPG
jgi:hypothetical protein